MIIVVMEMKISADGYVNGLLVVKQCYAVLYLNLNCIV